MSVLAADVVPRFRIADPKPAYCSVCIQAARDDVDFVDANAVYDGPTFVHPETGVTVHIQDDIYVCLSCVAQMSEVANFRPELHAKQAREIRRLELAAETWQQRANELERLVAKGRPEPVHQKRGR
jgi:hypothetical protein